MASENKKKEQIKADDFILYIQDRRAWTLFQQNSRANHFYSQAGTSDWRTLKDTSKQLRPSKGETMIRDKEIWNETMNMLIIGVEVWRS